MSLQLSQEVSLGSVALSELDRCALSPLIVVVRADDDLKWLPPAGERSTRRTETCLTAHLGLSFSLRCGLNAILPMQPDAAIVALADQPFITASLVNRLIDTYERNPGLDYVASTHEGLAMPPALFSKEMFTVLQELDGDKGAAGILRSPDYKGVVLETDSAHCFMDADTEMDFGEIRKEWSLRSGS
ncbi:NTP transferase domain-containing protein [Paenibacillus sp. IHBB 3054]|uniref:NTP transferase domain-containing protein n=1 Tax=Paenibacillus sp. IHBB 3054 TaxID=3425689 RepID=UPI003F67D1E9